MKTSFLAQLIQQYYPITATKIEAITQSNKLVKKLSKLVYDKLENAIQKYADIAARMKLLTNMLIDWRTKNYKDISSVSIFLTVAILLYFVSPIDLIPDFIPIIGGLDDALLLGFLLKVLDAEIEKYSNWKANFQNA